MAGEAANAELCAHCGAELKSTVYGICEACKERVCPGCREEAYCQGGRPEGQVELDPAEGARE